MLAEYLPLADEVYQSVASGHFPNFVRARRTAHCTTKAVSV
jgi:hypothetical protein